MSLPLLLSFTRESELPSRTHITLQDQVPWFPCPLTLTLRQAIPFPSHGALLLTGVLTHVLSSSWNGVPQILLTIPFNPPGLSSGDTSSRKFSLIPQLNWVSLFSALGIYPLLVYFVWEGDAQWHGILSLLSIKWEWNVHKMEIGSTPHRTAIRFKWLATYKALRTVCIIAVLAGSKY